MPNGCTNTSARNFDPAADVEDYSCIYLEKYDGVCYHFTDVQPDEIVDESFTLSFSLDSKDWVFFHDYFPDYYFMARDQLFNLKNRKIYKNNLGAPGVYHSADKQAFFIDAVFTADSEMILNSVEWISEVLNQGRDVEFTTFTHITIWNSQQCTGRQALSDVFDSLEYTRRKTQSVWSFNTFRDLLKDYGTTFLEDIFNNFAVDTSKIDAAKPWFDQDLLHDNFFVVRFEFDNTSGNQFIFHAADINANKSAR